MIEFGVQEKIVHEDGIPPSFRHSIIDFFGPCSDSLTRFLLFSRIYIYICVCVCLVECGVGFVW